MGLVHQIWHGKSEDLAQRFKPGRVNCIVTDPPFGVDNLSNQSVTPEGKQYARKIENDETPEQAIAIFQLAMGELLPKTADNCDCYIFTSYQVLSEWLVMTDRFMKLWGFSRKAVLVWEKDGPGMGDTNCPWGMGSEFILFFRKGNRDKTTTRRNAVLHVPQVRPDQLIHPHEKPTALLELFIKASTSEGDFIVDPFGGSGSLVRAAQRCGRSAVAIESNEYNARLAQEKLDAASGGGMNFE